MRLLTARRAGRPEHTPEEIEVIVEMFGGDVALCTEDGDEIVFNCGELLAAITEDDAGAAAA